jgi:DNA polymerase-3 subunit delta
MPGELPPEYVLGQLEKGRLSPFYLFCGPSEFRLEKVLTRIRETYVHEGTKDFDLHLFYGDDNNSNPAHTVSLIVDTARTFPFVSANRLIIVRRVEAFPASVLEGFLPYLDEPLQSTCLIFVASKPDFRKKFYRTIRDRGLVVNFKNLHDNQVEPWINRTAKDMGLEISDEGCAYLHEVVGNRLGDLYSELEKLYLRHGEATIGIGEVRALVLHSRIYNAFELMDEIAFRRCSPALSALKRFIETEGRGSILRAMGMLNRQIRLLWQTKSVIDHGGRGIDVARKLGLKDFQARRLDEQARHWSAEELEAALELLYRADGFLKSGLQHRLVIENLVLSLCASGRGSLPTFD